MLRHIWTVSAYCASSFTSTPSATEALNTRAPSRCRPRPCSLATSQLLLFICSRVSAMPPAELWVFSTQTRLVRG